MADARETIQRIGENLAAFAKSGPEFEKHSDETKSSVLKNLDSVLTTVEQAAIDYKKICENFLDKIIQARGIPIDQIYGSDESISDSVSTMSEKFDELLPSLNACFENCVNNYRVQADEYLDQQLSELNFILNDFLEKIPIGGTKDKKIKSHIALIKKELRQIVRWEKQFYVYKASAFLAEVKYIFSLQEGPIAAVWRYSWLDEQGEYRKNYDHKILNGKIYAVRDNWAMKEGLMISSEKEFVGDIVRPAQEVGCMCNLQWIYNLRQLPNEMMTQKGRSELERVRTIVENLPGLSEKLVTVGRAENNQQQKKGWLARLFS